MVRSLWLEGPLSRSELYRRLEMTPNAVGSVAEGLIGQGVIRECQPEPSRGGRPRVPLEIDPHSRHVLGISIRPGQVEAARLGLNGQLIGETIHATVGKPGQMIAQACELMQKLINPQTFAIGVCVPGFVDLEQHEILFSSATPGLGAVSLKELFQESNGLRITLENDMHAAGARWMLTSRATESQDILLVGFDDGELGATLLIGGRANRGCVNSANELGHTRFFVPTKLCYCGQTGCLERIFSSEFLHALNSNGHPQSDTLAQRIEAFDGQDPAILEIIRYLAMGLANATNFVRPSHLVLASELTRHTAFAELLVHSTRQLLLTELAHRVNISVWDQLVASSAETAGWLALAGLYTFGWSSP